MDDPIAARLRQALCSSIQYTMFFSSRQRINLQLIYRFFQIFGGISCILIKKTIGGKNMSESKEAKYIPQINSSLRRHVLEMPETVWKASGILIWGRRIKSLVFTTDVAIIRNCNADAVLAVYPFTPQQVIMQSVISASYIPVFCGVGGGTTQGPRAAILAKDAEARGAIGVVVNNPIPNDSLAIIKKAVDIPIVVTVFSAEEDIEARLEAGASILNVSAAERTPGVVRAIREKYPTLPIIATGGPTAQTVLETIQAGANAISYTPPSTKQLFTQMMEDYRKGV